MKKIIWMLIAVMFLSVPLLVQAAEFDSLIANLNMQADADMPAFKTELSARFGVSSSQVDLLIKSVDRPADAYMCLRVGQIAKQPAEVVLKEYKMNKRKGWGVIAKNLGIKPGSKEFHELKKGVLSSAPGEQGKGKGKGKKK